MARLIKSRRLKWADHVARMKAGRNSLKLTLNQQEEGPGVDGRTILGWILKKQVSIRGIGLIRLRMGIIGEPL